MTEVPGPVAVYVHWPYCARICPYCDFNVVRDRGWRDEQAVLVEAILTDLSAQAALVGARPLASIFFGGGTPSLMRPDDVARVVERARALFPSGEPVEITLEANPTDAEAAHFAALRDAGVDRLSLGVQSLDDAALAFLGRNHSAAEARRAIETAGATFDRLSIDLIYALPGQTVHAWSDALTEAVAMGFEHVSPYHLTIEAATAFGRAYERGTLVPPDEDRAADLYEATQAVLGAAGFEAYEVSNHARGVAARSAHNLHVWRGHDYIGVGPGAHGRLTLDGVRTATVAERRIGPYVEGVASGAPWSETARLDARETAEERVLLGLRTVEGVALGDLSGLGLPVAAGPVAALIEDGFVAIEEGRLAATARGRPVLDAVLKALLT
ncbi:radical SAM family heme chaperone HemW [Brevundimonas subvibrioides]|uniref:Heme chaperone HemW n=1 Tax=Brevundimonas subvibrioides (strain ATCC 15264 / DSM 4735 / LMG 14903 / NBRC 16000 / CB 81) TaxID=633149 RepID=D9QJZ2_BRESC|nr:radical SAM family heme chaperone HemW [Brevundimonas subvibrioides]ADK99743.1 oxygen-independent coproporphyrinogen III oxidase [Brevundimonas subvibrioides ATCC 15264]